MPDLHPTPGPWGVDENGIDAYIDGDEWVQVLYLDPDSDIMIDNESDARVIAYAAPLYHAAARLARARTLVEQAAAWEEVVRVVGEVEGSAP